MSCARVRGFCFRVLYVCVSVFWYLQLAARAHSDSRSVHSDARLSSGVGTPSIHGPHTNAKTTQHTHTKSESDIQLYSSFRPCLSREGQQSPRSPQPRSCALHSQSREENNRKSTFSRLGAAMSEETRDVWRVEVRVEAMLDHASWRSWSRPELMRPCVCASRPSSRDRAASRSREAGDRPA